MTTRTTSQFTTARDVLIASDLSARHPPFRARCEPDNVYDFSNVIPLNSGYSNFGNARQPKNMPNCCKRLWRRLMGEKI